MPNTYLAIGNLYKEFGNFTALSNINFSIKKGEFICFLGPSGCGKTTLLRTIAGLEQQSSGFIWQNGKDISNLDTAYRDFGIVFQSYALFPNLTVAENITLALKERGVNKATATQILDKWLKIVGLEGAQTKYPAQLSGGQQQRVALARALVLEPGLLLLDEPLSALDAKIRDHLRVEIKQLQKKLEITTIMVTHDQEEALAMADRIVVMNNGRIEQIGTPQEIYHHPQTEFVAKFIGNVNFIAQEHSLYPLLDKHNQNSVSTSYALRPEKIQLVDKQNNALPAQIINYEFLGSSSRICCQLSDGTTLEVETSNHGLQKNLGDQVYLHIIPELAHSFTAQGAVA